MNKINSKQDSYVYMIVHRSYPVVVGLQVAIYGLEMKAGVCPKWSPVCHTRWNVLQQVHIHSTTILSCWQIYIIVSVHCQEH